MSGSWVMNMNDNAGVTNKEALALAEIIIRANQIMEGFMSRFPAPECKEQQEVVDAAKEWQGVVNEGVRAANTYVDMVEKSIYTKVENN